MENIEKIVKMFGRKKNSVPIPDIAVTLKENSSNLSDETHKTSVTKPIVKKDENPPVDFYFEPMQKITKKYIKYVPKMAPIGKQLNVEKIDYMILSDQWDELKTHVKGLNESMKDIVEEVIDKYEKYTQLNEISPFENYKEFIRHSQFIVKGKIPSDTQLKAIYNTWVSLRKKSGNALIRMFWRKPDLNDNSPIASFRSRVPEKMQTRRKNKNDKGNFTKLRMLRKEIMCARTILVNCMKRENLKLNLLDLEHMEIKQKLQEMKNPGSKSVEFQEYQRNESERLKIHLPERISAAYRFDEDEEEKLELPHSDMDMDSLKSIEKLSKKRTGKDSEKESNFLFPEQDINHSSDNGELGILPSNRQDSAGLSTAQPTIQPVIQSPTNMKAVVDPVTVMQFAILFQKLNYIGMQVDDNRIKISSHKVIKKEDYLNLSQKEIEREQYFRCGTKPKSAKEKRDQTDKIKFTIFQARNGRILILRKPEGGKYEVIDKATSAISPKRIEPESFNSVKRIKLSETEETELTAQRSYRDESYLKERKSGLS